MIFLSQFSHYFLQVSNSGYPQHRKGLLFASVSYMCSCERYHRSICIRKKLGVCEFRQSPQQKLIELKRNSFVTLQVNCWALLSPLPWSFFRDAVIFRPVHFDVPSGNRFLFCRLYNPPFFPVPPLAPIDNQFHQREFAYSLYCYTNKRRVVSLTLGARRMTQRFFSSAGRRKRRQCKDGDSLRKKNVGRQRGEKWDLKKEK